MTLTTLLLFLISSAAIIAMPGPTVLLALHNGSNHGVRAAAWGMGGAVLADALLVTAVACGLGILLQASETLFQAVKWLGAAYLVWLGWKMLRSTGSLDELPAVDTAKRSSALFVRCFVVALTNPKALLFMSAFLPQFIDSSQPQLPQYAALAAVLTLLNVSIMLFYALCGARLLSRLQGGHLRVFNRVTGGLLMTLGAVLAFYRRGTAS
ncbi:LysE family translocator [Pseudomonas gingeri NCPPB 3146 = LMG 5327]|uniref:LysE family translocator n=2 Tax=Pseudomonas gingeri TaxID=117681 RepID=A0A7Y7XWS4_9PSED|nr:MULTISPECIES: LysE family translocator [Pseudomonas]NVZ64858.1 LysE family translocator [Pseudomonas gingeri]NVZ75086.1 LysE family translocator [Pseudomonas gingeri]NWA08684.1 LysE family translocator [Pseudomonas gingeri]NWC12788.1 LysE family translocator [Pseudomonas gingeri]PNQ92314.1 LysE family translocator [Pseudomonas gingeri NCPPB 3146 = LMG 5327]